MERVVEASKKVKAKNIITVQGDEPLITPKDIEIIKLQKHCMPQKKADNM